MKSTVAALLGFVSSYSLAGHPFGPAPSEHTHCGINVATRGNCHDIYYSLDNQIKDMGPGGSKPV